MRRSVRSLPRKRGTTEELICARARSPEDVSIFPFLLFTSSFIATDLPTPPCSKLSPQEHRAYHRQQLLPPAPLLERHVWYRLLSHNSSRSCHTDNRDTEGRRFQRASTRLNRTTYILYHTHQATGHFGAIGTCFTSILRYALRG